MIEDDIKNIIIYILSMVIIFFVGVVFGVFTDTKYNLKDIQNNGFIIIDHTIYNIVKDVK